MENELVVLRVCQDINEAYLLRSVLAGSGVESFIPDENVLSLNYPPIAIAAHGVRLMVHKDDVDRACEILTSTEPSDRS